MKDKWHKPECVASPFCGCAGERIAELEAKLAEVRENTHRACSILHRRLAAAESREKALREENKALREALRAFQHGGDFEPDDRAVVVARAALAAGKETP